MKKRALLLVALLLLPAACGTNEDGESAVANPTPVSTPAETAPTAQATALPLPTDVPAPTPDPARITSTEEMAGIWLGTVAGERGYVLYTANGRYTVALIEEALTTAPLVTGEYWFEDGRIHLRDLENVGHWTLCPAEDVGVYEARKLEDGQVQFQVVEEPCSEGGFTRGYLFTNMKQAWVAEPEEIAAPPAGAQALPELAAALQAVVDTWVTENGAPGVTLLVDAPDVSFAWQGAAGMADPEEGIPMLPEDQFIISSMTKMMTAVTVMKLAEIGAVGLDDSISAYLPAELVSQLLVLDGVSYGEAITIRQLLQHRSGLGDFSNGEDRDGNGRPDFKDMVLDEPDTLWNEALVVAWAIANAPPVGQPGEVYNYSDTNYQLLGMIVEAASGMPLAENYRRLIFEPLGMEHTYFEFRESIVPGIDGRGVSHAYYENTLWNALDSHSYEWGSGGLVSTAADMNRFLQALVNDELFDDPASKAQMMAWTETADAGVYYGLGLIRFVLDEWDIPGLGETMGHGGLFNSLAFYWPDQNVTIVGTLNSNEPPLGFIGLLIEVMMTFQELAGG